MALNLKICLLFAILVVAFGVDGRYFKQDKREQYPRNVCEEDGFGECAPFYLGSKCAENKYDCSQYSCGLLLGVTCCCDILTNRP